jgi:hypothetical protein
LAGGTAFASAPLALTKKSATKQQVDAITGNGNRISRKTPNRKIRLLPGGQQAVKRFEITSMGFIGPRPQSHQDSIPRQSPIEGGLNSSPDSASTNGQRSRRGCFLAEEHHAEAVDAEADAARGGHAVFEGDEEIFVELLLFTPAWCSRRSRCSTGSFCSV